MRAKVRESSPGVNIDGGRGTIPPLQYICVAYIHRINTGWKARPKRTNLEVKVESGVEFLGRNGAGKCPFKAVLKFSGRL